MKAAIVVAIAVLATSAAADTQRPAEVRFGFGAGRGTGRESTFSSPSGTALGAMFDAGWWASRWVTFGVHLGWAAFEDAEDDPRNTPHHSRTRYSYLHAHATTLVHWWRLVAGGGIGFDLARTSLLETDGMERSERASIRRFGVHVQLGIDVVKLGPGTVGAFALASGQPIPLSNDPPEKTTAVLGGLSYAIQR